MATHVSSQVKQHDRPTEAQLVAMVNAAGYVRRV
jgi:hypothetical protein